MTGGGGECLMSDFQMIRGLPSCYCLISSINESSKLFIASFAV